MSLPILKVTSAPTTETLIRYFHQTEAKWSEHIAEQTILDCGTAWTNPQWPRVRRANHMFDVALADGIKPADAMNQVNEHFAAQKSQCWYWVMNPSAVPEQTAPMVEYLLGQGYKATTANIMYLERIPSSLPGGKSETIQIIPARASFKHARVLHEENAAEWNEPQLVEPSMAHLDDPHYDALVAIQNGTAVATVGVLAMGEVGLIEQVFVSAPLRRRGLGATMMGRAIEICARSLFKHILVGVTPSNAAAIRLYEKFGFRRIGEIVDYRKS